MDPVGNISGLISGIDFRELVDQIIAIESRSITTASRQLSDNDARLTALKQYRSLLTALSDRARTFRDTSAFQNVSSSVSTPGTNATPLVGATTALGASPGSYQVEVLSLAAAEKVGSIEFLSSSEPLNLSGEFLVNGKRVVIDAADTLFTIRDKINDANSGADASRVTASVLTIAPNAHRLILSANDTGADGINLADGTGNILRAMGYLDATTTLKRATSGGAESDRFSSSTETIASLLGLTGAYGPANVTIAGQVVTIDVSTQSLTAIAASIDALSGVSATVESDEHGSFLVVQGTTSFVDANQTLELVGVVEAGRSAINQVVTGGVLTDGDGTTPATAATLLGDLFNGGVGSGVQAGDTLTISGTRGDGTSVSRTFTVNQGDQIQDLLDFINDTTSGFGSGARTATATIGADGAITLTDDKGGDSLLGLSIVSNNEGGGRLDFGTFSSTTLGRDREIVAGRDSQFRIDGVTISRSSNTISDVIPDVTLYLNRAQPNEIATVTIDRHFGETLTAAEALVTSYNAIVDFINLQTTYDLEAEEQPLFVGDTALRSTKTQLSQTIIATITGVSSDFANSSQAGISLTRDGHLQLNAEALETAFSERYNDLIALYAEQGTATSPDVHYVASGNTAQAGTYAVEITTAAAQATALGAGFSGTYADDGTPDILTITDTSSGGIATIILSNGNTTAQIIDALNTEFSSRKTHQLETNVQLFSDAQGTPVTESTTFASIFDVGGSPVGVVAGDTIAIAGTRTGGGAFEATFTVDDPATSTVGDLVTTLQQNFGSDATVSVVDGKISVQASTVGSSSLALALVANNEGAGNMSFGGTDVVVQGRQVLGLEATAVGNEIQINHTAYGSAHGFDVAFTPGGTDGTGQLGITSGTYSGADVVGTIGGYDAIGTGRGLIGDQGTPVAGLHLEYVGTIPGTAGQIQLTVGVGALLERMMETVLDIESGSLTVKEQGLTTRNERLLDRVTRMEDRLEVRRRQLLQEFFRMEELVSKFQAQQQMLAGFINNSLGRSLV